VDEGNVRDGDALRQGNEDVAPSLAANGGAVGRNACAGSKTGEVAEGWLEGGGDAHPAHRTAQNPF
jgi:hypothetical protein